MLFGRSGLRLNALERKVAYRGQELVLGELSFKLLSLLAERAPSTVPFDVIEKEVWSASATRETVKQRVKLLRDDLSRMGVPGSTIEAMRNAGYRLTISVHEPVRPRIMEWALGSVLAALAVAAVFMMLTPEARNSRVLTLAIKDDLATAQVQSSAWRGISQTLTRNLTKLDSIAVVDPIAGKAVGSDLLVTLTPFQQDGESHYSVRLTDRRTFVVLWAENYRSAGVSYDLASFHAVNNIQAYVAALGGDLGTAGYPAQTPENQHAYMIALKHWRRGDEASLLSAQTRLRRVIKATPVFELAQSLLARVDADLVLRHGYSRSLAQNGIRIAQQLVDKYPDFADFRYSHARTKLALGDSQGALADLRQAVTSMPFLARDIRMLELVSDTVK